MPLGFEAHDHSHCVTDGVALVKATCKERGLQLTPVRLRVLEILLAQHQALGAYEILDILREEGLGSQPPVAYRALDFLVKNGFAHRIERLNAFTACSYSDCKHRPVFLICDECNTVAEVEATAAQEALGAVARDAGFQIEQSVVEIQGRCTNCQDAAK